MIISKKDSGIAFFDFDGTITTFDTFLHFIYFVKGKLRMLSGLLILIPLFILMKFKIISNHKTKELVFSFFLKGMPYAYLKLKGEEFSAYIDKRVNSQAIEKLKWHKFNGDEIFIVTASSSIWVEPWCRKNGLKLIGTEYEVENKKMTGKILGKNCYGVQKVTKIKETCNLLNYKNIYAYGDTSGDLPMLGIANNRFYRKF